MNDVHPANLLGVADKPFSYVEKTNPRSSGLDLLTYGVYEMDGPASSGALSHRDEEALLFGWKGDVKVAVAGQTYQLAKYDVLYIPRAESYWIESKSDLAKVVICRAAAENTHPVFYGNWAEFSKDESRIRHLKGKDVFLMFDVGESADKLMAGYTIFEPNQRSWPPHNHTDQEEVYIFTQGSGAMQVYEDEESMSFVHSVREGDAVTIPLLNYHPVFSHDEELHFIWCIAGNRYWVGDKNKDFASGKVDKLTT